MLFMFLDKENSDASEEIQNAEGKQLVAYCKNPDRTSVKARHQLQPLVEGQVFFTYDVLFIVREMGYMIILNIFRNLAKLHKQGGTSIKSLAMQKSTGFLF